MAGQRSLGSIDDTASRLGRNHNSRRSGWLVRWLLPLSWILAAAGYFGPWVAHKTAALTVTGADLAEFVKFLPGVGDGVVPLFRQLFYLPPIAVVVGVALLLGSRQLRYPPALQALLLGLCVPLSLQLLPPAWSPGTLLTAEFRLQMVALGLCWLLLASFWLLARLLLALRSALSASLALLAAVSSGWQFITVKPAVDAVYGSPINLGWGFVACLSGLGIMAATCLALLLAATPRRDSL